MGNREKREEGREKRVQIRVDKRAKNSRQFEGMRSPNRYVQVSSGAHALFAT